MLKKIISLVSTNRGIRKGEEHMVDYNFVPLEEIQQNHEKGELLQHVKRDEVEYGYLQKDFDEVDELIVVCGDSGVGKDSLLNDISKDEKDFFSDKNYGFLFSIPRTIPLFYNHAAKKDIPITVVFLDATPQERLKRITAGDLLGNKDLLTQHQIEEKDIYNDVKVDLDLNVQFRGLEDIPEVVEIITNAKVRTLRYSKPQPFDEGIGDLLKSGYVISTINTNSMNKEEVKERLLELIKVKTSIVPLIDEDNSISEEFPGVKQ